METHERHTFLWGEVSFMIINSTAAKSLKQNHFTVPGSTWDDVFWGRICIRALVWLMLGCQDSINVTCIQAWSE